MRGAHASYMPFWRCCYAPFARMTPMRERGTIFDARRRNRKPAADGNGEPSKEFGRHEFLFAGMRMCGGGVPMRFTAVFMGRG
jgi:hypothetical protein